MTAGTTIQKNKVTLNCVRLQATVGRFFIPGIVNIHIAPPGIMFRTIQIVLYNSSYLSMVGSFQASSNNICVMGDDALPI